MFDPASYNASSSSSKRSRNGNDNSSLAIERPTKRRGIEPKSFRQDVHHLKRDDIPEDAGGFKTALETHIRILLGCMTNTSVPEVPDIHVIKTFELRFTNALEVDRLLKGRSTFQNANHAALVSLRDLRARCARDPTSNIALAVTRVPENSLRLIFATVRSFGLPDWRPDLLGGTPTSLYNGALENIALWTFEQAATSFAYAHLSPNMRYIHDTSLIQKLYKSFLWSYMKGLALKEHKEPGSVSRALQENKAYKSRIELTNRRREWLRNNGWNDRLQLLATDVECTSDQESNPDGAGFLIMFKRARNPLVTDFFRTIDTTRQRNKPLFRGQRSNARKEEPRVPHPLQQESRISARLPRSCPLDWFDPQYFNEMDIEFRALYVDAPIALPSAAECCTLVPPPDWKNMSEDDFMEKYGNAVRAKYKLPTEEELRILRNEEEPTSDEEPPSIENQLPNNEAEDPNDGGVPPVDVDQMTDVN